MQSLLVCFMNSLWGYFLYFYYQNAKKCTRFSNNAVYINIDGNRLIFPLRKGTLMTERGVTYEEIIMAYHAGCTLHSDLLLRAKSARQTHETVL